MPTGRPADQRRPKLTDEPIVVPTRADINYVPEPQTLMTLINSAIASLRRGVVWDRGTILNILA
ncbi:MAG: hypothetical protein SFT92_06350 [Rickettsiales bacterium]|nr:hypothetical protein [Rickettsiales bacterium]